jgi:hypothetical protein
MPVYILLRGLEDEVQCVKEQQSNAMYVLRTPRTLYAMLSDKSSSTTDTDPAFASKPRECASGQADKLAL